MAGRGGPGFLRPLLVVVALLVALNAFVNSAADVVTPNYGEDQPHAEALKLALGDLRRNGARDAVDGLVDVVGTRLSIPTSDILDLAGDSRFQSAFFTYDLGGRARVTASAMGTDWRHHIVNGYLVGYRPFEAANVLEPLQVLAMRKRYQYDHLQYAGRGEIWQTSEQAFESPRGDCEDHAIALADWLIEQGEDARVVLGQYRGGGHAWVVLFRDGQTYLLEATRKQGVTGRFTYPLARFETDYHPEMMFNRDTFWANSGSRLTTDYNSSRWIRKSRYRPGRAY